MIEVDLFQASELILFIHKIVDINGLMAEMETTVLAEYKLNEVKPQLLLLDGGGGGDFHRYSPLISPPSDPVLAQVFSISPS